MSTVVVTKKLLAAIVRGDVRALDRALQSGVSPDSEIVGEHGYGSRRHRSLLFLATEVRHSFELFVHLQYLKRGQSIH